MDSGNQQAKTNIHTMKINKHTNVKVSLKIRKRIWNKRVFVSAIQQQLQNKRHMVYNGSPNIWCHKTIY